MIGSADGVGGWSRLYGAAFIRAAILEFSRAINGVSSARSVIKSVTKSSAMIESVQPQPRRRDTRLGGDSSGKLTLTW